jgi:hypothetical protein
MTYKNYVVDATISGENGPLCVIPVEGWPDDPVFVIGMNIVGSIPKGGRMVGIIHEDGQAAVDDWFERNKARCEALVNREIP